MLQAGRLQSRRLQSRAASFLDHATNPPTCLKATVGEATVSKATVSIPAFWTSPPTLSSVLRLQLWEAAVREFTISEVAISTHRFVTSLHHPLPFLEAAVWKAPIWEATLASHGIEISPPTHSIVCRLQFGRLQSEMLSTIHLSARP